MPEQRLEPGSLEADKQIIAVLLAQFNACRAEIQARSANQAATITLNITAVGIIAGYYFSAHGDPMVLLVIPLISPMLGIIWADHAINIGNLGRFIQTRLMPTMSAVLHSNLPDYEVTVRAFERQRGQRLILLVAPMLLLFAVLPVAALLLAFAAVHPHDLRFWSLSVIGAVLVLVFGGYSVSILFGWIWGAEAAAPAGGAGAP